VDSGGFVGVIRKQDYGFTIMHLRLIDSPPAPPDPFELPAVDLKTCPTRPGMTHSKIELRAPEGLALAAGELAVREGLREDCWIGLVIESERAVAQVARGATQSDSFRAQLDERARRPAVPIPGAPVRLARFAAALRELVDRPGVPAAAGAGAADREVMLGVTVAYQSVGTWRRSAIEAGQTIDAWAIRLLQELPRGRVLWEAAAAERGESLAEWVLTQAARR
jgi:hypothetical protein